MGVWYYQMQDQHDKQRCSLLCSCVNGRGELDTWTDYLLMWCENCPGKVVALWCHNELDCIWMNFDYIWYVKWMQFWTMLLLTNEYRIFYYHFFTSDAFFLGSSVCHICKLLPLAINMFYCYWSVLGWVITHLVSYCGAFGSVLCDDCPLVPLEEKRNNVFSWPPLIHFKFCKKWSTITRVVYILEFC